MATTTNQLSWEAFERLPDDGTHHELIEGELQTLPPVKWIHLKVAKRVYNALVAIEERARCSAYQEAGYKLTSDPASWIQPDVSLVDAVRVETVDPWGYVYGAPQLAVEVISPSESASDVERKIELLLEHGSLIVWVIYPRTRKVQVYLKDGTGFTRGVGDVLSLDGIVDGFALAVADIFEQ